MNFDKQEIERLSAASASAMPDHQLRLAFLKPADVEIVTTSAGPGIQIGHTFLGEVQALQEAVDSVVAGVRAQLGIEPSRSAVTLGLDHSLSVIIDLGADAPKADVEAVVRGYVNRLVPPQPSCDGANTESTSPLTPSALEVLTQAAHATLVKRGNGAVDAPYAISLGGRELARVQGQYLPKPELSDPRPQELSLGDAHINGWNRKKRRCYLELKLPGSKKPQNLTVNWDKCDELGPKIAHLSVDPNNKVNVILVLTRERRGKKRYELLFIEPA